MFATEIVSGRALSASTVSSTVWIRTVAVRWPGTNTGTPETAATVRPNRRSVSLNDPRYAPGVFGSGAVAVSDRPSSVRYVCNGGSPPARRVAMSGAVAAARTGSAAGVKAVRVVTPGKCQRRGARNDHCAWRALVVSERLAALVVTCANGAGLAVGVTAVYRAPPLLQANLRSAQMLIHSPCQSPFASGSISHTRPCRRS